MATRHISRLIAGVVALLFLRVNAACECGYTVNSTDSDSFAVFSDLLETDFLHLSPDALEWDKRNATGWSWQVYNVTPGDARGQYGKDMQAENVILNPMKSRYDWAGPTELGGDGGLQLWVRGEDRIKNKLVSASEIVSMQGGMMYGSYRIGVKWTGTPGTCGSFFWYRNNSMEIDVEYLSWQQAPNATSSEPHHPINLVNQTPESAAQGYDAAGTPDFHAFPLPFDPSDSFHEYRFDWTPGRLSFYADGVWLRDMTHAAPDAPGRLFVNHWSNGDAGWSAGPPAADAVMTVSYIKAYFNSTAPDSRAAHADRCAARYPDRRQALRRTCRIPDQRTAPRQSGPGANDSSRTFFFSPPPADDGAAAGGRGEGAAGQRVFGSVDALLARVVLALLLGLLALVVLR